MSWLTEAQNIVYRNKREQKRSIDEGVVAKNQELNEKLDIFYKHTEAIGLEIQRKMLEVKQQDLKVEGPIQGWEKPVGEAINDFILETGGNADDGYWTQVWNCIWKITIPKKYLHALSSPIAVNKSTVSIHLGLTYVNNIFSPYVLFYDRYTNNYLHRVRVPKDMSRLDVEIETFIKDWLLRTYQG